MRGNTSSGGVERRGEDRREVRRSSREERGGAKLLEAMCVSHKTCFLMLKLIIQGGEE